MKTRSYNLGLIISLLIVLVSLVLIVLSVTSFRQSDQVIIEPQEVLDLIVERRSIRKYADRPVEDTKLTQLLQAGMAAPSSRDRRPVHLLLINQPDILKRLGDTLSNASMLSNAPLAVAVLGDTLLSNNCWMLDASAATQNILLMAHALGLGAVWTAAYPYPDREAKISSILNIPSHYRVLSIIPIGYPDESPQYKKKYDTTHIHLNHIIK